MALLAGLLGGAGCLPALPGLTAAVAAPPTHGAQRVLAQYRSTDGPAFDRVWIAIQSSAHRQAMALGNTEALAGGADAVIALARRALPYLETHSRLLQNAQARIDGRPVGTNPDTDNGQHPIPPGSSQPGTTRPGTTRPGARPGAQPGTTRP